MRILLLFAPVLATVLAIVLAPATATAQSALHGTFEDRRDEVRGVFADLAGSKAPGAAVAVVIGDSVVYADGFGLRDVARRLPITPETTFMIASVSKQFTSFAALLLDDEGVIDIDGPANRWLPGLPDYAGTMTLRHFMNHTSGFRDSFDMLELAGVLEDDVITADTILALAYAQEALNFAPGSAYSYSNTGYVALMRSIEAATGESFQAFMERRVFGPLGMDRSYFHEDRGRRLDNHAIGYYEEEDGFRLAFNAYESVGETGLVTTVLDLARWARNFRDPVVGSQAVIDRTDDPGVVAGGDTLDYAAGLRLATYRGRQRVSHGGWHRGFRTYIARFPADDLAVVVLANSAGISPQTYAMRVVDTLIRPSVDSLAVYNGTYVHGGTGTRLTVDTVDGRAVLRHPVHGSFEMSWEGPDAFGVSTDFADDVVFDREEGRVTAMRLSTGRSRNVLLRRQ